MAREKTLSRLNGRAFEPISLYQILTTERPVIASISNGVVRPLLWSSSRSASVEVGVAMIHAVRGSGRESSSLLRYRTRLRIEQIFLPAPPPGVDAASRR